MPIDAQNALILELSAGILPKFSASVRGKSKIPHFSRNRSAFLMGTGQTVPPFYIAERTQNLTRRQKNFPSFPLKPRQPPNVLLSYPPRILRIGADYSITAEFSLIKSRFNSSMRSGSLKRTTLNAWSYAPKTSRIFKSGDG